MTITPKSEPETEGGLLAQAQERGVSLDAYVRDELSRLANGDGALSSVRKLNGEECARQFDEWTGSFPDAPSIADEALSRENLYRRPLVMRVLIDANILVRAVERSSVHKRIARQALRTLAQQGDELCVMPQNIAGFWNVCTRPIAANGLGNAAGATDRLTAHRNLIHPPAGHTLSLPEMAAADRCPRSQRRKGPRCAPGRRDADAWRDHNSELQC